VVAVPTTATKPRGIRVRTAHTSEAEFIAAFIELCDEGTIFAPTEKMKPIGVDCAFSLELVDGTAMVRGLGVIRNAWPTEDSPFGRPGIHIKIDQLTTGTEPIFGKLLEARTATAHKPRSRPAPSTHQLWGPPAGPPTEEMNVVEVEEPEVQELPHKITKELKSPTPPEDLTHEAFMEDPASPGKPKRAGTIPNLAPIAPVQHPRLASAPIVPIPSSAFEDDVGGLAVSAPKPWWMNARVGGVFAAGLLLGLLMSFVVGGGDDDKKVAAAPAAVAKAEPANCPPPPEPTAVAAAAPVEPEPEPEIVEAPPTETKARTAKSKQVAVAAPGPKKVSAKPKASSIETKTAAAIKPTAFASIKAATTTTAKPVATTTTKPTTTKPTTTKTNVATTTKTPTTTTKPAATTSTKPATTKGTTVATTKPATTTTAKSVATTSTKPATTTKTTATKPTATKPTTVATTKPAAKPKKGACSSLDCL